MNSVYNSVPTIINSIIDIVQLILPNNMNYCVITLAISANVFPTKQGLHQIRTVSTHMERFLHHGYQLLGLCLCDGKREVRETDTLSRFYHTQVRHSQPQVFTRVHQHIPGADITINECNYMKEMDGLCDMRAPFEYFSLNIMYEYILCM